MIRWDAVAQSVISGCTITTFGVILGRIITRRPLRRHQEQQALIADRLDPETPGGLGDLVQRDS